MQEVYVLENDYEPNIIIVMDSFYYAGENVITHEHNSNNYVPIQPFSPTISATSALHACISTGFWEWVNYTTPNTYGFTMLPRVNARTTWGASVGNVFIRGRAVYSNGQPVSNMHLEITLRNISSNRADIFSTRTDVQGNFEGWALLTPTTNGGRYLFHRGGNQWDWVDLGRISVHTTFQSAQKASKLGARAFSRGAEAITYQYFWIFVRPGN